MEGVPREANHPGQARLTKAPQARFPEQCFPLRPKHQRGHPQRVVRLVRREAERIPVRRSKRTGRKAWDKTRETYLPKDQRKANPFHRHPRVSRESPDEDIHRRRESRAERKRVPRLERSGKVKPAQWKGAASKKNTAGYQPFYWNDSSFY